jgi:hypothetical protein
VVPEELHAVGDLVKLHENLFYAYGIDEPFKKASPGSAYYAIGMKPYMVGIIVRVFQHADLIDPELWLPYNFIYKVWWSGGIGYRREQHEDLVRISKA